MLKLATIGTGSIVEMFLESLKPLKDITIYAVYSRKEETGRKLADKFKASVVYTNLEEMLNDKEIDCVYVASPNSLHYEQALAALQAKKHVLCEKPFTSTVKQFEHLVQTAKENNVFLMEAIINQHLPNYAALKQDLHKLGPLKMIQCNFSQYSSKYDAFLKGELPNVFNPVYSGGALSDINIYNLHFCIGLFGKPKTMKYLPNKADNGIDTSGTAILNYGDFIAVCTGCKDSRSRNMVQIQGEKGYLVVESESSHMIHGYRLYIGKEETHTNISHYENWMSYEADDFIHMILNHDTSMWKSYIAESRDVMQIYEALRKDAGIFFACDN